MANWLEYSTNSGSFKADKLAWQARNQVLVYLVWLEVLFVTQDSDVRQDLFSWLEHLEVLLWQYLCLGVPTSQELTIQDPLVLAIKASSSVVKFSATLETLSDLEDPFKRYSFSNLKHYVIYLLGVHTQELRDIWDYIHS